MPKFTIDLSSIGGLAPQHEGDLSSLVETPSLMILGAENQYAMGNVNPLRRLGYLSPSNDSYTQVTGTANISGSIISVSQIDPVNNKIYFMSDGQNFLVIDSFSDTSLAVATAVTTATLGTDMEIYTVNGTSRLFYSYQDSNNSRGDIGIFNLSATYDKTWLSTTVANTAYLGKNFHKFQKSDNGLMYVLDGSNVHQIDGRAEGGTNGTFTANSLSFIPTITLVDSVEQRGLMYIALQESTVTPFGTGSALTNTSVYAGVYVWDRQTTIASNKDFIRVTGIKAIRKIFILDGVIYLITLSTRNRTQVREFTGNSFEVVEETSFENLPNYRDSVQEIGGGVLWFADDGKFVFYGRPTPKSPKRLFVLGNLENTINVISTGAIAVVGRNITEQSTESVYFADRSGSVTIPDMGIWFPFATTDLSSTNINCGPGNYRTLATKFSKLSTIDSLTLYYPPTVSGAADVLDVGFYFNQSSTAWATAVLTRDDGARSYRYIPVGEPNVNFLQLALVWDTSIPLSQTITPSFAEIEYTESTKKK